jgi:hypothetical protein
MESISKSFFPTMKLMEKKKINAKYYPELALFYACIGHACV